MSYAKSAEHALEEVESSVTGELDRSLQPSLDAVAVEPPKYSHERAKVVISVQGKDGQKQFRVYMVYFGASLRISFYSVWPA